MEKKNQKRMGGSMGMKDTGTQTTGGMLSKG